MSATYTPVRYPGGKSKIYPLVKEIIIKNGLSNCTYSEAFAGGAGLAMKLLLKGDVPKVIINDLDRAVWSMWDVIINHSDELCGFVKDAILTVEEWKKYRDIYRNQDDADSFELGKAAFYLNRTNVSGILDGGLIGGLAQNGNYKMDARFSRDGLIRKIQNIAKKRDRIELHNLDAECFISNVLSCEDNVFANFDPPYVKKGPGLYRSSFDAEKHKSLARTVLACSFPWMATYDDDPLIDELYKENVKGHITLSYSAHSAGQGTEKLILSDGLTCPL